jgi:hypothetical protein
MVHDEFKESTFLDAKPTDSGAMERAYVREMSVNGHSEPLIGRRLSLSVQWLGLNFGIREGQAMDYNQQTQAQNRGCVDGAGNAVWQR